MNGVEVFTTAGRSGRRNICGRGGDFGPGPPLRSGARLRHGFWPTYSFSLGAPSDDESFRWTKDSYPLQHREVDDSDL